MNIKQNIIDFIVFMFYASLIQTGYIITFVDKKYIKTRLQKDVYPFRFFNPRFSYTH